MDFFQRQNQARRKTELLLFYFLPAVALTVAGVCGVAALVAGYFELRYRHVHLAGLTTERVDPHFFIWAAAGTLLFIAGGALYKMNQLRSGGSAVAAMLGGRWVNPQTTDPHELQLRNVVEEMAIASGVPPPEVYILPDEEGINAFVAGHTSGDAVICVTEATPQLLTRDELQAVIAHEFSHLLNGDMGLNLWLVGLLNGVLCITLVGKGLCWAGMGGHDDGFHIGRRNRGLPALILVGGALFVVGSIGYFFSRLVKSAVCRQREILADAASVQFTRNPQALAGALKKVGGLVYSSRVRNVDAEQVSHLFFCDALPEPWFSGLATHPPLIKRIKFLDPSFDGVFPHLQSLRAEKMVAMDAVLAAAPPLPPLASTMVTTSILAEGFMPGRPPTREHLVFAAGLLDKFPEEIAKEAHEPFGAIALVYAMLFSRDDAERNKQIAETTALIDPALLAAAQQQFPVISPMTNAQKLALTNLCLAGLRQMSPAQFDQFKKAVQALIESDGKVSLFEYTLGRILRRHLQPQFEPALKIVQQYYAMKPLLPQCAVLLSALARNGNDAEADMAKAFKTGAAMLNVESAQIMLLPFEQCDLPQIDDALDRLNQAVVPLRNRVVRACAYTIAADNVIQEEEADLLRAIADALDCPLPPFVSDLDVTEGRARA